MIRLLRCAREISSEIFHHSEAQALYIFVKVNEIYLDCVDGLYSWVRASEENYWPCSVAKILLIDPQDDLRVLRGSHGSDKIYVMQD